MKKTVTFLAIALTICSCRGDTTTQSAEERAESSPMSRAYGDLDSIEIGLKKYLDRVAENRKKGNFEGNSSEFIDRTREMMADSEYELIPYYYVQIDSLGEDFTEQDVLENLVKPSDEEVILGRVRSGGTIMVKGSYYTDLDFWSPRMVIPEFDQKTEWLTKKLESGEAEHFMFLDFGGDYFMVKEGGKYNFYNPRGQKTSIETFRSIVRTLKEIKRTGQAVTM